MPPTGSSAQGCCRQQISLLDLFDARYHKVVVVTKPPPGPPQFGTLWSLWSVVPPQSQDPLGGATTPWPQAPLSQDGSSRVVCSRFSLWLWSGHATHCCSGVSAAEVVTAASVPGHCSMSLCLGILWKIPAPNGWSCAGGSGRDGASAAAGTALPLCITFGQDGN